MTQMNRLLVLGLILYFAASSIGRELPRLECDHPKANQRYNIHSGISVLGRLTVPLHATIGIRIHHVGPDGKLFQHFGASGVKTSEKGIFSLNIDAPPGGWLPGKNRVVIRLDDIPHVIVEREFEAVAPPGPRPVAPAYTLPAKSSGVTIDSYREPKRHRSIPSDNLFLISGELSFDPPALPDAFGPSSIAKIEKGGVTMQSGTTRSLWDPLTKKYWFELQLRAPKETGESILHIEFDKTDENGKRQREKIRIPLSTTDADPLAIVGSPGGS